MDGTDLRYFVERLRLALPEPRLPRDEQRRLFLEPRCHGAWLPQDVPDTLIEEAWALARMGPTSANGSPLRLVLLRGAAEKARLLPHARRSNRDKSRLAPVVAILAHDVEFWRRLDRLHPHADAAAWFRDDPGPGRETAFRNGTLQAAYFIFAIRALGADVGALSGFDATACSRRTSPAPPSRSTSSAISAMVTRGSLKPRLPRLDFEEIVHRPADERLSRERATSQGGRHAHTAPDVRQGRRRRPADGRRTAPTCARKDSSRSSTCVRPARPASRCSPEAEGFAAQGGGPRLQPRAGGDPRARPGACAPPARRHRGRARAGLRPLRRRSARLRAEPAGHRRGRAPGDHLLAGPSRPACR